MTTVREELQSFLEDDDDMMKMCLTHKKEHEQQQAELQRAGGEPPSILCTFAWSRIAVPAEVGLGVPAQTWGVRDAVLCLRGGGGGGARSVVTL